MSLKGTTPIPNVFLDERMKELSSSAVRVYLKIIRNTLGWRDREGNYKRCDWISHSQFEMAGVSSRSVTKAIEELLNLVLIKVTDDKRQSLSNPQHRKLAKRIYYAPILQTNEINTYNNAKTTSITKQNLPSTKEIDKRKYSANERMPDNVRIHQIQQEQERKQIQRDS
jgi:hypothetical protein